MTTTTTPAPAGSPVISKAKDIADRAVCLSVRKRTLGNRRHVRDEDIGERPDQAEIDWEGDRPVMIQAAKAALCITKRLLDSAELRAITNMDTEARRYLDSVCLPSSFREGVYLLPIPLIDQVDCRLQEFAARRLELVEAFLAVYPAQCAAESDRLRKLHNPNDYVPLDLVRNAFGFDWQYIAFSVPGELKSISSSMWRREQKKTADMWDEARREIQTVLRASMAELVDNLVDKLRDDPETGKPRRFQDTTVSKLQDFLATFSARNLADDAQLAGLVDQAKLLAMGVSAEDLRQPGALRAKAAAGFAEINKTLAGMIVLKGRKFKFEEAV